MLNLDSAPPFKFFTLNLDSAPPFKFFTPQTHHSHTKKIISVQSTTFPSVTLTPSNNLSGTLAHLTALTTKTTHALLLPFFAHASRNLQQEVNFLVFLNAVSREGALRQLCVTTDEADEMPM